MADNLPLITMLNDARFAIRLWRKRPLLIGAAIITLALGTGVNAAIFSLIHAVVLKPLPYPHPEQLIQIWTTEIWKPEDSETRHSDPNRQITSSRTIEKWRGLSKSFERIAYYSPWRSNLTGANEPRRVSVTLVSSDFFETLGIPPILGRTFTPEEILPGKDRVAILSHNLWKNQYGADHSILGKTVNLDAIPHTVIGVMPPGFRLFLSHAPEEPELYLPISILFSGPFQQTSALVVGRLKASSDLGTARAEMEVILRQLEPENQERQREISLIRLDKEVASDVRLALLMLMGAAACVLLIACMNLANLMLSNAVARQRELAVRAALGASHWQLIKQLLTESLLMSLIGNLVGLLFCSWVTKLIVGLYPGAIPRADHVQLEPPVLTFTFALMLITGLSVGLVPAWRYSQPEIHGALKSTGFLSQSAARGTALRHVLVTVQVAGTFVLLVGASLLLRSFWLLKAIDPGYRREDLITTQVVLPEKAYASPDKQVAFANQFLERIRTIPFVRSAGITNSLPLIFNLLVTVDFSVEGHAQKFEAGCRAITSEYFQTMGIVLLAGRYLEASDASRRDVTTINQSLARRCFPGQNPVGRQLVFGKEVRTIVGMVADIKNMRLAWKTEPELYLPFSNMPSPILDLAVRTSSNPEQVLKAMRSELLAMDPHLPLGKVQTMEQILDESVANPRFHATLLSCFAGLALLLATVGIYAIIAYSVSLRTHEFGIRMALGAQRKNILWLVFGHGMLPPLLGITIGLGISLASSKVLESLLYGIQPTDALSYSVVALVILIVSILACYIPARRATKVDPMTALRYE